MFPEKILIKIYKLFLYENDLFAFKTYCDLISVDRAVLRLAVCGNNELIAFLFPRSGFGIFCHAGDNGCSVCLELHYQKFRKRFNAKRFKHVVYIIAELLLEVIINSYTVN